MGERAATVRGGGQDRVREVAQRAVGRKAGDSPQDRIEYNAVGHPAEGTDLGERRLWGGSTEDQICGTRACSGDHSDGAVDLDALHAVVVLGGDQGAALSVDAHRVDCRERCFGPSVAESNATSDRVDHCRLRLRVKPSCVVHGGDGNANDGKHPTRRHRRLGRDRLNALEVWAERSSVPSPTSSCTGRKKDVRIDSLSGSPVFDRASMVRKDKASA